MLSALAFAGWCYSPKRCGSSCTATNQLAGARVNASVQCFFVPHPVAFCYHLFLIRLCHCFHDLVDPRFFGPHIESKRDRQTGDVFEVLDGLMFKDGFLYKPVSIKSIHTQGIQPSFDELEKFKKPGDDMNGDMKLGSVIWKANVPEKIRFFAWCAASNSLAVQVNRVTHH